MSDRVSFLFSLFYSRFQTIATIIITTLDDSSVAIPSDDWLIDPPPKSSKLDCLQLVGNDFKGWFLKLDKHFKVERTVDFEKSRLCSCI